MGDALVVSKAVPDVARYSPKLITWLSWWRYNGNGGQQEELPYVTVVDNRQGVLDWNDSGQVERMLAEVRSTGMQVVLADASWGTDLWLQSIPYMRYLQARAHAYGLEYAVVLGDNDRSVDNPGYAQTAHRLDRYLGNVFAEFVNSPLGNYYRVDGKPLVVYYGVSEEWDAIRTSTLSNVAATAMRFSPTWRFPDAYGWTLDPALGPAPSRECMYASGGKKWSSAMAFHKWTHNVTDMIYSMAYALRNKPASVFVGGYDNVDEQNGWFPFFGDAIADRTMHISKSYKNERGRFDPYAFLKFVKNSIRHGTPYLATPGGVVPDGSYVLVAGRRRLCVPNNRYPDPAGGNGIYNSYYQRFGIALPHGRSRGGEPGSAVSSEDVATPTEVYDNLYGLRADTLLYTYFWLYHQGGDVYRIHNVGSGLALDVSVVGNKLVQWYIGDTPTQLFAVSRSASAPTAFEVKHVATGKHVGADGSLVDAPTPFQLVSTVTVDDIAAVPVNGPRLGTDRSPNTLVVGGAQDVGINTSKPGEALSVLGNAAVTDVVRAAALTKSDHDSELYGVVGNRLVAPRYGGLALGPAPTANSAPYVARVCDQVFYSSPTDPARSSWGLIPANDTNWFGAVTGHTNMVYCVPCASPFVFAIDSHSQMPFTIAIDGVAANQTSRKWMGGALGSDGNVYGAPHGSTSVLVIEPDAVRARTVSIGTPFGAAARWVGGAAHADAVFFVPNDGAAGVLRFDTRTAVATPFGVDTAPVSNAWRGACVVDGVMYCAPANAASILAVDLASGAWTAVALPAEVTGSDKYCGCVAVGAKVYFVPCSATRVAVLDTRTRAAALVGSVYAGSTKWSGAAVGADGKVYCAPSSAATVLVVDPSTDTTAEMAVQGLATGATDAYAGMAAVGRYGVFACPARATKLLRVAHPRMLDDVDPDNVAQADYPDVLSVRGFGRVAAGSGCVGINCPSPSRHLHVRGNTAVGGALISTFLARRVIERSPYAGVVATRPRQWANAYQAWGGTYVPQVLAAAALPSGNTANLAFFSTSGVGYAIDACESRLATGPADAWRGGALTPDGRFVVLVPHAETRGVGVIQTAGLPGALRAGELLVDAFARLDASAYDTSTPTGSAVTVINGRAVTLQGTAPRALYPTYSATLPGFVFPRTPLVSGTYDTAQGAFLDLGPKTWDLLNRGFTFACRLTVPPDDLWGNDRVLLESGGIHLIMLHWLQFVPGGPYGGYIFWVNDTAAGTTVALPYTRGATQTVVVRIRSTPPNFELTLRVNGQEATATRTIAGASAYATLSTLLGKYAYQGANYVYLDATMHEAAWFDRALTNTEIGAFEAYLSAKWTRVPTVANLVTTALPSGRKWAGGLVTPAQTSNVYMVPAGSNTVSVFDTATMRLTHLTANTYPVTATQKWCGGALARDGRFYCAPHDARQILVIDPATNLSALTSNVLPANASAFSGAVTEADGSVLMVPHASTYALSVTPGPVPRVTRVKLAALGVPTPATLLDASDLLDAAGDVLSIQAGWGVTPVGTTGLSVTIDSALPALPHAAFTGQSASAGAHLVVPNQTWTALAPGGGIALAAMVRFDALLSDQRILVIAFQGFQVRARVSAGGIVTVEYARDDGTTASATASTGVQAGAWTRVVASMSVSADGQCSWTLVINGTMNTAGVANAVGMPSTKTAVTTHVAAPVPLGSAPFASMSVRELALFDGPLDAAALAGLEAYLATKWLATKWSGGCVGPDGTVYCAPHNPQVTAMLAVDPVLEIQTTTRRMRLVPSPGGTWSGLTCVPGQGSGQPGALVGMPYSSNTALSCTTLADVTQEWMTTPYVSKF